MVSRWINTTIGNIANFQGGSQPPFSTFVSNQKKGYVRLIQIRDYKTDKYLTYIPEHLAHRKCSKTDIMIGRYGPPIFQILRGIEGAYNVALIKAIPINVDQDFLYYTLKREDLFNYIDLLSRRTSGQTGVNLENLREYEISIPVEISDQQEIARALSDADNLINNTEKLIEKKKAIKQGVMQELLTGKRRLPGFSGEWENMTIGQHGYLQKGSINPQTQPDDYFTEYSMPAFDDGRAPAQTLGKDMHSNRTVIRGKTLLFNKLNVRQQRIWLIEQCESNAVCSAEFLPYCSTEIDLKLLSQILYTDKVTEDFIGMSTGTSNSQKRITPKAFLDYTIYLPKDMEEQKALSKVFDDMDKEIEALDIQLEKYKKLKIGMMSKLLTGEIRLAE